MQCLQQQEKSLVIRFFSTSSLGRFSLALGGTSHPKPGKSALGTRLASFRKHYNLRRGYHFLAGMSWEPSGGKIPRRSSKYLATKQRSNFGH